MLTPATADSNNGDIVGYLNRGLNWTDPKETADRYEVLITYDLDAADLPLNRGPDPRRCQASSCRPARPAPR